MNVFDLSAKIMMDTNGYLKGLSTAKAITLSTASVIGSAVSGFMDESISAGKRFDSSMSQVAATMGKSMDELATSTGTADTAFGKFNGDLRQFAQFMGRNTAFTASQAAEALNYMALAGYDTQESMDMLPNVLSLAAAGNMDLAKASDMVTDTQTAFGISSKRTTQLVDEMAKASSTGNTSVEQLGDAFLVVGGLAQELNGGLVELEDGTWESVDGIQELEIALTAMANAGIKGSEAGTHMRNMLLKLSSPTDAGTQRLQEMGVAVFDTEGKMRSLADIFNDLNNSLSTMTQEEKIQAISDLFNTRDLASAEALLNAVGQDWDEIGRAILDADGAAQKMADTQLDNLEGDTKLFESALEGLQIALSDAVTPALRTMKQEGTEAISGLTEAFQALPPELQTTIALVGDFGGKLLSVSPQIVGFVGSLAQIKTAQSLAGASTTSFVSVLATVGPALAVAGAAIAGGIILYKNYKERIQEAAQAETDFANQLSGENEAYATTHEQVKMLVEGQNEYISSEERIAQMQALRVQVANEQITAGNNLNEAQQRLKENAEALAEAETRLDEARQYSTSGINMQAEEVEKLKLKQAELELAVDSARDTYQQTTLDLDEMDQAIVDLEATQQEAKTVQEELTASTQEAQQTYEEFLLSIPEESVAMATAVVESVTNMNEALSNGSQSLGGFFDALAEQQEQSADTMKENLEKQIEHMKNWESDLQELADLGINKEFLQYLADMGPSASEYVVAMKDDIITGAEGTVDEWNALFSERLALAQGVNDEAQGLYDTVAQMTTGGSEELDKLAETFNLGGYEAGTGMMLGLSKGLEEKMEEIEQAAKDVGEDSVDAIDEGAGVNSPSWKTQETGENMVAGLVLGIHGTMALAYSAGENLSNNAVDGVNNVDIYGNAYYSGCNLAVGMANGINDYASLVSYAAYNMAHDAVETARNVMEISSPSKVSQYFGKMFDKGFQSGIEENEDGVIGSVKKVAQNIIGVAKDIKPFDFLSDTASDFINGSDYATVNSDDVGNKKDVNQMNVTMNIYGAEGQNIRDLAVLISQELAFMYNQEQAVWA